MWNWLRWATIFRWVEEQKLVSSNESDSTYYYLTQYVVPSILPWFGRGGGLTESLPAVHHASDAINLLYANLNGHSEGLTSCSSSQILLGCYY